MGKLLAQAGVPILFLAARRIGKARQAVRFVGKGRAVTLDSPQASAAPIILLTTSDSALAGVAEFLARSAGRARWTGKVVLHTCGSIPSSILVPLKRRGAAIGSLHPFQTVPSPAAGFRNLRGGFWAIEGDAKARRAAGELVKTLQGVAFRIRPGEKTLYHLAAFLVSPTTVTLMERSTRLLKKAGVPRKIAPLMLARFVGETTRNFAELGARRALTGPAVRGDWQTLERHIQALRKAAPDLLPVYAALLRAMLRLARRRLPHSLRKALC